MKASMQALAASLVTAVMITPTAQGADLKQLAEQLVNKKESPQHDTPRPAIREGGRTVSARQRTAPAHPRPHHAGIAIQEEGANVKKEKGVEDVE